MRLFMLLASLAYASQVVALSFDEALAIALREAPALFADAARIDAARQLVLPAGELPDPKLALGLDNLPINGANAYSLNDDFMTMRRIGLMQEFPNHAKRNARVASADGQLALTEANARITRLSLKRDTALAWITRYSIERQLAQVDLFRKENHLFDQVVRAQLVSGGPVAAIVAPRQEAAFIAERLDELTSRRHQAIATLRRWIGAQADESLKGIPPAWAISPELLVRDVHRHPELLAFDPETKIVDAQLAEAIADKKSDWALEVAYQKRGAEFGDMLSMQVSIDLPLFTASRQDRKIAAKRAERLSLDGERESLLREHQEALEVSLAEHRRLDKSVNRQQQVLMPLAKEKVQLAMADWRSGKGTLTDLIDARRENIELALQAIELEGERQLSAARLHYSYSDAIGEQP